MKQTRTTNYYYHSIILTLLMIVIATANIAISGKTIERSSANPTIAVRFKTIKIDNLDIFYREAGDPNKPAILLLHGFPTSSHMFRNLIPKLAENYYVIAPDYPGYGFSSAPKVSEFDYSFDNLSKVVEKFTVAVGVNKYSLYLMDYGAPVGFRLAVRHPKRVEALIVQNGNAYEEGLREFWKPFRAYWKEQSEENAEKLRGFFKIGATKWQYTHGTRNPKGISPDNWAVDQYLLDRKGNNDIQLRLFLDYGTNPALYPKWQAYFRKYQPPTLVVWGKNDFIFPAEGAAPYKRDLKNIETHMLNTGHFALEEDSDKIARYMVNFLQKQKIQ